MTPITTVSATAVSAQNRPEATPNNATSARKHARRRIGRNALPMFSFGLMEDPPLSFLKRRIVRMWKRADDFGFSKLSIDLISEMAASNKFKFASKSLSD